MLNTKPMLQARCLFSVAPMACTHARTTVPVVNEVVLRPDSCGIGRPTPCWTPQAPHPPPSTSEATLTPASCFCACTYTLRGLCSGSSRWLLAPKFWARSVHIRCQGANLLATPPNSGVLAELTTPNGCLLFRCASCRWPRRCAIVTCGIQAGHHESRLSAH